MSGLGQFVTKSYDKTPVKQRKEKMAAASKKKILSNPTVRAAAKRKQAMAEKNIIAKKATAADKKMVEKAQSKSGFKRLNSISTAKRGK